MDKKLIEYNIPTFIVSDPISIPHLFTKKQDIEIAAFFASIFSWGNRTTIIHKAKELMQLMDNAPHQFIIQHQPKDLKKLLTFKHRTFNATDLLYFIQFFKHHYSTNNSLETAFSQWINKEDITIEKALVEFHHYFFSLPHLSLRTFKHIATPLKKSTCKRINMFLRSMVRKDKNGVDFGIWNQISPAQLICPIDIHVARVAKKINLITRTQIDWLTALELTTNLKKMDYKDPTKYDIALFSLGVIEKF